MATERLANVPTPGGTSPESPQTISTAAGSTPSSSAAICAKVVSWPWPCGEEPVRTHHPPVGLDADLGALPEAAGALHVHADADADDLALRAGAIPLLPEAVDLAELEHGVEATLEARPSRTSSRAESRTGTQPAGRSSGA